MPVMTHKRQDRSFVCCCKIRIADKRSARVIDDLQNHCGVDENVGLTYFYIDGSDPKPLSIDDLYRSCLAQLGSRKRTFPRNIASLYSHRPGGGYATAHKGANLAEQLRSALHELLRQFDHTYIALDALDEAEDSIGLENIITFLKMILSNTAEDRVHMVIFSRNLERLRNLFKELGATSIAVDGRVLDLDLQMALQHQLCYHPKFARWPVALKKSVEESLLAQTNGSYVKVSESSLETVQILIDAGADLNPFYPYLLGTAIEQGRKDMVELLVKHGSDMHQALRDAAVAADLAIFRMLLKLGADIHRRDPDDETSMLGAAAWGGSTAIIQDLLDGGLQDRLKPEPGETTPLMEAVRAQRQEAVNLLLANGADVNTLPPLDEEPPPSGGSYINGSLWPPQPACETALTLAIRRQYRSSNDDHGSHEEGIARALMEHGALVSPNTPVMVGTPLLYATWEEADGLDAELLERGADPNQRGTVLRRRKPTFPLLLAAEKGDVGITNQLIEAGARVNDQDKEGFSALHIAAACDNTEALKVLVEQHHANLNVRLWNGSRPIHSAASKGTPDHLKNITRRWE